MVSLASGGPSVNQAPAWMKFSAPNASTITHSQVVPRNSDQPSRSSPMKPERSAGSGTGTRTPVRIAAETSQADASTASAQPGPTVTTSAAAMVGPSTTSAPRAIDISTLACCSCSRGTSWGSTAAIAGNVAAARVPLSAASTRKCQCSTLPVITSSARAPCASPAPVLHTRITRARPKRSATTPPTSRNTTIGMLWAASTWPSATDESSSSSTANASATPAIVVPDMLTTRAAAYRRKLRSRRGAKTPIRFIGPSRRRRWTGSPASNPRPAAAARCRGPAPRPQSVGPARAATPPGSPTARRR